MAYSYSTNIKYAVRFRSTSVWGGFVSWIFLRFLRTVINDEILLCKRLQWNQAHDKGVVNLIVTWKTNFPFKYFLKSPPSTVIYRLTFGSEVHVQLVKD